MNKDELTSILEQHRLRDCKIAKLEAKLKITDELLKEATETIGAVVACCTYNSNDAVSAGKVSVDVKRELTEYIVSRNCNVSDVSMTQDVLTDIKTPRSIENNNPDYYKHDAGTWIPIASGKLPEKFQECIVLDKNKRVHNWIHDDVLLPLFAQYTHWMPLPNPPEVK